INRSKHIQYFPVEQAGSGCYPVVILKVKSNHGNSDLTCIYRVQVHGKENEVEGYDLNNIIPT
ncbi:hypothetical protein PSHT_04901, partial [Puccinia striiformis]